MKHGDLMKQRVEYQDFLQNLSKLIEDYCLLTKKDNPLKYNELGDDVTFHISDEMLHLNWEEITYPYGEYTVEYNNLSVPLNFYENTENIVLELAKKEEKKKQINEKIDKLRTTLSNLSNKINLFNKDKKQLDELSNKYSLKFDVNNLDVEHRKNIKEREKLIQEINELNEMINEK